MSDGYEKKFCALIAVVVATVMSLVSWAGYGEYDSCADLPTETMVGSSVLGMLTGCVDLPDGCKYSAKGLPSGLKINAKTGVISGSPKKAGTFTFAVKATVGKGKSKYTVETDPFTMRVLPIPGWLKSAKFYGVAISNEGRNGIGMLAVKNGKVSGSMKFGKEKWTIPSTTMMEYDNEEGYAYFTVVAKCGKLRAEWEIGLYNDGGWCSGENGWFNWLSRDNWKDKDVAARFPVAQRVGIFMQNAINFTHEEHVTQDMTIAVPKTGKATIKVHDYGFDEEESWNDTYTVKATVVTVGEDGSLRLLAFKSLDGDDWSFDITLVNGEIHGEVYYWTDDPVHSEILDF